MTDEDRDLHADAPPPAPPIEPAPPAAPPMVSSGHGRVRGGAIWWGVVLVLFGGLLLLNQFVPGVEFWRFWPLIVIALGLRGMFESGAGGWTMKRAAEGLTVVAVGLIFLGQMLGYLAWDVWFNIFRLWPLLLVALGLEIIGKGAHAEWLRVVGSLVVIGGLAYGALVMSSTGGWPFIFVSSADTQPFSESAMHIASVEEGTARIDGGVGDFTLRGGSKLATAEGRSPYDPRFDVESGADTADVRIDLGTGTFGPGSRTSLDVTLDRSVVWDLDVRAGVSDFDVDLSELTVSALTFEAGVSGGTLSLGEVHASGSQNAVRGTIDGGISTLTIRVPEGENVRIRIDGGLTSVNFDGTWDSVRDGERRTYESDGFRDSRPYWDIVIDAGIGTINVEYY